MSPKSNNDDSFDPEQISEALKNLRNPEKFESILDDLSEHLIPKIPIPPKPEFKNLSHFSSKPDRLPEPVDLTKLVPSRFPRTVASTSSATSEPPPPKESDQVAELVEATAPEPVMPSPLLGGVPEGRGGFQHIPTKIEAKRPIVETTDTGTLKMTQPSVKKVVPKKIAEEKEEKIPKKLKRDEDLEAKLKEREKKLQDMLKEDKGNISSTSI